MIEIIPAILEKKWVEIEKKIKIVGEFAAIIQIDIADGVFVNEESWRNSDDLKNGINFEIDMMISEPEKSISDWINTGAKRLVIHIESTQNLESIIRLCKKAGVEVGVALNIETPNEVLDKWINQINSVQFMGIAKIGFQGQSFDNKVLDKIKDFRAKYSDVVISVDGGVNFNSANLLKRAGANRLIVGSCIWNSDNPKETFKKLMDV